MLFQQKAQNFRCSCRTACHKVYNIWHYRRHGRVYIQQWAAVNVLDYDELDKDEETHDNRQDQQHATASDINCDDHQDEQALKTLFQNVNEQTSTLLTDLFTDNIPLHEAAAVQENLTAFKTIYKTTTDTNDFTIPPVDTTKVYKRRNQAGEDSTEECYIPSTTNWFEGWNPSEHISDLNLEDMNIGTQTQKELDYCSTPLQLTAVIYDTAAREASNKNKKVQ
ncbi:hypothetical protein Hanom_Chr12g01141171 [Helianthus anomalus]